MQMILILFKNTTVSFWIYPRDHTFFKRQSCDSTRDNIINFFSMSTNLGSHFMTNFCRIPRSHTWQSSLTFSCNGIKLLTMHRKAKKLIKKTWDKGTARRASGWYWYFDLVWPYVSKREVAFIINGISRNILPWARWWLKTQQPFWLASINSLKISAGKFWISTKLSQTSAGFVIFLLYPCHNDVSEIFGQFFEPHCCVSCGASGCCRFSVCKLQVPLVPDCV